MGKKLDELKVYSSLQRSKPADGRREITRNISYEEYYCRWGYLPPGFEIKLSKGTIYGGCPKWREHADRMGYPERPDGRFLDKTYRPWLRGDEKLPLMYDDVTWDEDAYARRKRELDALR